MKTLKTQINAGLLVPAHYLASSHCDERPEGAVIDMVVVHGISLPPGDFGTGAVAAFFCGNLDLTAHAYYPTIAHLRVSSHLFIDRQGEVTQFVPFSKRAWHAGESSFQGRNHCNDFSIGIELEGTDTVPYAPVQYEKLAQVVRALMQAYPEITQERIVGHSDIAPARKTDPGPVFDWTYLRRMLT